MIANIECARLNGAKVRLRVRVATDKTIDAAERGFQLFPPCIVERRAFSNGK